MYTYHSDPAHGFMEVPLATLAEVGLIPTEYSFRDGARKLAFLEEDCDASAFVAAFEKRFGARPDVQTRYHDVDAPCRRLPRFDGTGANYRQILGYA